tara:strand:- start:192 stop:740 length:549 start_codon:yes stop_codon:yes gene_type:complete
MIKLIITKRTDKNLLKLMKKHYSKPKGFVGRNICYAIYYDNIYYGHIVGGSCTLNLPNRNDFFKINKSKYNNIINNIFYHIEKFENKYPLRNFTTKVLQFWREQIKEDWYKKYGDKVIGFESLIEPPRTADLYKKDNWKYLGKTKGFTCKRIPGKEKGVFKHGKRVWDYKNLKPKLVYARSI